MSEAEPVVEPELVPTPEEKFTDFLKQNIASIDLQSNAPHLFLSAWVGISMYIWKFGKNQS